jgi:Na+-transporting NADH:ubiquinone oxidoreductase subunit NqrC
MRLENTHKRKEEKNMKKAILLSILAQQQQQTKKTTRQDIISLVADLVQKHIKDNAEINGINLTRDQIGVNLGEVVEVIMKSLYRNKLAKSSSNQHYDLTAKGEKVEVKFTTCDAYAHPINKNEKVGYYLIVAYSKKLGGMVFKVPYENRNEIDTNNQARITINQKQKFFDKELTARVFGA